ncbi:D-3-phosphoglycerate dehydrogenase 2, chloroplastic-like [Dorcoceras hygrometricum]|uniref:D-3-phosphoglycerate dehydrogenase 2, chloroplastic-like n=1 Tax=Dorcoceras hygrometricum TaxID=472368 RepID=A0A2Z7A2J1_9LAMI|nr:D-3-phosphoglycerate dehydrogenase 2, chloroplastic-like [Dorcoceras hygrometricum]
MASSLFTNTLHVCFDSFLAMDHPGMVLMFEALIASGISGFLGFPAVLYEDAWTEFFLYGSVWDGKTISVNVGSFDAVTQERFLMMAAITCGVSINWNRLLFNILKDMVTAGSRQPKGYGIQISLLLENVPNLELYIAVNDKVGVEEVTDVPRVKKTPIKKAVYRKRPAAVDEPIVKMKRTRVGKGAAVSTDSALEAVPVQAVAPMYRKRPAAVDEPIVKMKRTRVGKGAAVSTDSALEAVPVQAVAPISSAPPHAPQRNSKKRKRRLGLDSDDEIIREPTTVAVEVAIENIVEEQRVEMPVGPVDQIIEQVIAETTQVETDVGRTNDSGPDIEDQGVKTADETELWFNLSYEEFATREANRPVET